MPPPQSREFHLISVHLRSSSSWSAMGIDGWMGRTMENYRSFWHVWSLGIFLLMSLFIFRKLSVILFIDNVIFSQLLVVPIFPCLLMWQYHNMWKRVVQGRDHKKKFTTNIYIRYPTLWSTFCICAGQSLDQTFIASSLTVIHGALDVAPGIWGPWGW